MSTTTDIFGGLKTALTWLLATAIKAETSEAIEIDGRSGLVLPTDRKFEDLTEKIIAREQQLYDLEEKRGAGPRRIKGTEEAQTLEGFCALVNRHKGATTKIAASLVDGSPRLVATIDYHGASDGEAGPVPRWGQHHVVYEFPFSRQFLQWRKAGEFQDKKTFLDWVDKNYVDVAYPADVQTAGIGEVTDYYFRKVMMAKANFTDEQRKAADLGAVFGTALDMLRGVRQLSTATNESLNETKDEDGSVSVEWKRADRLVDPVKVKRYYLVELKVFDGDSALRTIPCELVTRAEGGLSMKVELLGIEKIIEAAFDDARAAVLAATGLDPIRMRPGLKA